ncbi:T9SS type A sorting domain-containing protein [Psychroflexus sp. YR1-1]|uniref:T9SS type A sorting domain-containing protein n=1 Tax=Psychroflexus aurantiacus TaxID=2709310 RepID=A0A6B3R0F0_9FLAO|nr:endonuclease [Psychroflexus aurantiacus]NEV94026.1 T9SS type A sorting domain-containing protein [Psychroflexus aurantiacus]
MKYYLLLLLFFALNFSFAQAPENYYNSAEGLLGYELKTALKTIIDDVNDHTGQPYHQDQGYGALYTAYDSQNSGDTDHYFENDGTVLDMYSERVNSIDSYTYDHFQNQCGTYLNEGDCYNREHLVPQSTFNSASPMKNDYFHVVPSDGYVNGVRGSYPFGEVSDPDYTSDNGSKRGPNTFSGYTGTVFEPIDEFKGDIARSVLYFAIRYEDEFDSSWKSNGVLAGNPKDFFLGWYIDLLLSWHSNDPVSQREIDRNNNGFQFQGNRNPLIDHPEFASQIWENSSDNQAPTAPLNLQADVITDSSVKLIWEPAQDNIGVDEYIIEQDNVTIQQVLSTNTSYTVTGLSSEILYNFRVYAVDRSGNISEPGETLEVTTLAESNLLIFEDFENCNTNQTDFTKVREISDITWECTSFGENDSQAYQINAYRDGNQVPSLDWLITTDKINFDNYEVERLNFWTSASFGNTRLELLYSSTYDGNGNPSDFEWNQIPNISIPLHPTGNSSLFTFEANTVDISAVSGQVYIAFKYDTTQGENATRWTVDNFLVTGEQLLSNYSFKDKLDVQLYPNPSKKSKVHFDFNKAGLKTIEVYDITGRKLLTTRTHQKKYIENLNQLSKGSYFIKIIQDDNFVVKRLILN